MANEKDGRRPLSFDELRRLPPRAMFALIARAEFRTLSLIARWDIDFAFRDRRDFFEFNFRLLDAYLTAFVALSTEESRRTFAQRLVEVMRTFLFRHSYSRRQRARPALLVLQAYLKDPNAELYEFVLEALRISELIYGYSYSLPEEWFLVEIRADYDWLLSHADEPAYISLFFSRPLAASATSQFLGLDFYERIRFRDGLFPWIRSELSEWLRITPELRMTVFEDSESVRRFLAQFESFEVDLLIRDLEVAYRYWILERGQFNEREMASSPSIEDLVQHMPPSMAAPVTEGLASRIRKSVASAVSALGGAALSVFSRRGKECPAKRVVNTGFALASQINKPLWKHQALRVGGTYVFWVEVGELIAGAIDRVPTSLPMEKLPPEAKLTVAIFGFRNEIEVIPGADVGEIQLLLDGSAEVTRQPKLLSGGEALKSLERRLYFPIGVPSNPGRHRLRCNIYFHGVLIQARVVAADVRKSIVPWRWQALAADVDYTLSQSIDAARLQAIPRHRLSVMQNNNGALPISHQFRFFGGADSADEFKNETTLSEIELNGLLQEARKTMRRVCWGSDSEWDESKDRYKYDPPPNDKEFADDLISLARAGYRLYDKIANSLAGDKTKQQSLERMMREPGLVQFASKRTAKEVIPAALLYDHPLDTSLTSTVCEKFLRALGKDLAESDCFQGRCPNHGNPTVVCPSGFWGFRHAIGVPVSFPIKGSGDLDAPTDLGCNTHPKLAVASYPLFPGWLNHRQDLGAVFIKDMVFSENRNDMLNMLIEFRGQIVYFYCHGGLDDQIPYLRFGKGSDQIFTRDNLRLYKIGWPESPRPLIFINGCRTAALQPSIAFELVSGFIDQSNAAGVVGTEITIFEPLASAFAMAFFRAFVEQGHALGEAIRRARLALLSQKNPLGLVYIPFAHAGLSLRPLNPAVVNQEAEFELPAHP